METVGLEKNGSTNQAIMRMMGFDLPEPEVINQKLPKDKQPTAREKRGLSEPEWRKYQKRAERSTLRLQRDLESRGLTKRGPVIGRDFEPNRIFA